MNKLATAALGLFLSVGTAQAATSVYTNTFDSALGSEWSGITTLTGVGGYGAYGFSGSFLQNTASGNPAAPSVLNLTGLAAHSTITVTFLFASIDSWDGFYSAYPQGDYFNVLADGLVELQASPAQASGTASIPASMTQLVTSGVNIFGAGWADGGYSVSLTFSHVASSLTLTFYASGAGWQGGSDESWAIDNLAITSDASGLPAVPLPATAPLLLGGLAAIGGLARRLRRRG